MKCDSCGKEISNSVYWIKGLVLNCCKISCLAHLCLNMEVTTVDYREKYLDDMEE